MTNSNNQNHTSTATRGAPVIELASDGTSSVWYPPLSRGEGRAKRAVRESLERIQISFCATSIAVAVELQLGSIFGGSGSGEGKAIFYDAVATTDFYEEAIDANGDVMYALRHGFGFRLALCAKNLKIETNLSYAMVAAQAKGSSAEVSYEIQGLGIPRELIKSMLGALPASGPLDESSYIRLDQVLRVGLPNYLDKLDNPLTLSEYIVVPRAKEESFASQSRVYNFSLVQIARGRSLSAALAALAADEVLDHDLAKFLMTYVYSKYTGVTDPASNQRPPAAAISNAKAWLNV